MQEIKNLTDYKLALRDRIVSSAMHAFANGIKATKMDDIATGLGISKRTLYELYDTKEKLLYECIRNHDMENGREMAAFADNPRHDVVDIIVYLYRRIIREAAVVKPTFYEELNMYPQIVDYMDSQRSRQREEFLRIIHRGIKEGYFRSDLNYDIILHIFEALGKHMRHEHLYKQYSFEELFFNMLFITLRGICTSKGIEKLDCSIGHDLQML